MLKRSTIWLSAVGFLALTHCSAGSDAGAQSTSGSGGGSTSGTGGSTSGTGASTSTSTGSTTGAGGSSAMCDQVKQWVDDYRAAHPGNGGKDWDINEKTPAEIAADPAAQQLLALCTPDQRPVIPLLAWEYGGNDHQWINPQASALVYCVYTPVATPTPNWQYDAAGDHVTADMYVICPEYNPCKDEQGANQVAACIGDMTNFEILVDTASYHDGIEAGLSLSNASSDLYLILDGGMKVHLIYNP